MRQDLSAAEREGERSRRCQSPRQSRGFNSTPFSTLLNTTLIQSGLRCCECDFVQTDCAEEPGREEEVWERVKRVAPQRLNIHFC